MKVLHLVNLRSNSKKAQSHSQTPSLGKVSGGAEHGSFPDLCPVRLAELRAQCCRGGGRDGAPAEGLLAAKTENGGRARKRSVGSDTGFWVGVGVGVLQDQRDPACPP